ncbi:MAG: S-layer homology domain-containing protein [Dorea sp.]
MKKRNQIIALLLAGALCFGSASSVSAAPAPDGKTNAEDTPAAANGAYEQWQTEWETIKDDWTQMSLSMGEDETQINFGWYSKTQAPTLTVDGKSVAVTVSEGPTAKDGSAYYVCKATAKDLLPGEHSYQTDGGEEVAFTVQDASDGFSFIYVGDPQIGSSNELKGEDSEEFYAAQSASVCSDAFNWNDTLNQAFERESDASFVLSAGDQIQTTAKKAPNKDATNSEIEYAGYLSADKLESVPVATTVGNHDADNPNYLYHFNIPNLSELGSNDIVGGDYYYTYGDALFIMLNTQDTNVTEHKQFIEEAVNAHPDKTWRIVTLHQDIYGSAEHSNEPEITNLRYTLVPYFEENDIDVVLTGHDHAYSRSEILQGGQKTVEYTDDEFDEQLDKDMDAGEDPETRYEAPGNIKDDTTDEAEQKYLNYLDSVMDKDAVQSDNEELVVNPEGILYMTASSSSGSKYYDLVPRKQSYIAERWQEDVPTYSVINVDSNTFSIATYRTDNGEQIDKTFTIEKADASTLPYEDVSEDSWFYNYAKSMYEKGIMTGLTNTRFGPAETLKRAQFAVTLYRLAGTPAVTYEEAFPDVPKDQWYTDAIIWAYKNDVITGYTDSGLFGTADEITREQMVTMMYRYAKKNGIGTSTSASLDSFPDGQSVTAYALDAMKWAVTEKIIQGDGTTGLLNAWNSINRAETTAVLDRYITYSDALN